MNMRKYFDPSWKLWCEVSVGVGLPLCDSSYHHHRRMLLSRSGVCMCGPVYLRDPTTTIITTNRSNQPFSISLTHSLITNVWDVIAWAEGKNQNTHRNADFLKIKQVAMCLCHYVIVLCNVFLVFLFSFPHSPQTWRSISNRVWLVWDAAAESVQIFIENYSNKNTVTKT